MFSLIQFRIRSLCGISFLLIGSSAAHALTIQLQSDNLGSPPEVSYTIGAGSALELVLEIANDAEVETQRIYLWQLELQLQGELGSSGGLEFEYLTAPDGSLFGSGDGLTSYTEFPSTECVISDADLQFVGADLPAHAEAPIAKLGLLPLTGAEGEFVLSMAQFDENDIDETSYWASEDFQATPFNNPILGSARIELAIIHIIQPSVLLGDFNNDLVVDAADYTVWRDGLGANFLPEHYDVWKEHFGERAAGSGQQRTVPEPSALWLGFGGGIVGWRTRWLRIQ